MHRKKAIEDIYPLSPMQQGLLFQSLYAPDAGEYFEQLSCRLRGRLDVCAFKEAWQRTVDRHPVLRTAFVWERRDEPIQVVYQKVGVPWQEQDWSGLPELLRDDMLASFLDADRARGFEVSKPPLMRLALLRLGEDEHQFVWSHHHLLLDGWCLPRIIEEVLETYRALCRGEEPVRRRPRPFRDYVSWLRKQDLGKSEAYWREQLSGFRSPLRLGVDRAAPEGNGSGEHYRQADARLSAAVTRRLEDLARSHRLTLNTFVQGAWALLLSRYSAERDVVFGTVVSGRSAELEGIDSMIGVFINTLPARVEVRARERLLPWLGELQRRQSELRQFEYTPLSQVQGWSEVPADKPLFETILAFENNSLGAMREDFEGLRIEECNLVEWTHFPLTVGAVPGPEMRLDIGYDTHRFDEETLGRLLGHLRSLLTAFAERPEARLGDLPMLSASERRQILEEWNATAVDYPGEACLHHLWEARAERTPDAPAVFDRGVALSYREIDREADRLARRLVALGVGPEVFVGLAVERSADMAVGILGVLKAGGAFIPLDPSYPSERLAYMLCDSGISLLLTQKHLSEKFPPAAVERLELPLEESAGGGDFFIPAAVDSSHPAYAIYTSGSTGQPKAAVVSHRALTNYTLEMARQLGLGETDRILQFSSLSFDVLEEELFPTWASGGAVVLEDPATLSTPGGLTAAIARSGVTGLELPAAFWQEWVRDLIESRQSLPEHLRFVIVGSEKPPRESVAAWRRFGVALVYIFGLTETTITSALFKLGEGSEEAELPIGRPIANTRLYVLDAEMGSLPVGVSGELLIGGAGLARGYLGRPGWTAERFVPDPFGADPGGRLYRTGDRARYRADSHLELIGRLDDQVKIRGFRVEPGEVEAVLAGHPAVRQTAVVARTSAEGPGRLVAYVRPSGEPAVSADELRRFLEARVPNHMVPSAFVWLDSLPVSPNGKVDKQALPDPEWGLHEKGEAFLAPRTAAEKLLAEIWREVLAVERVGVYDNFFELGGDSILSLRIISRAHRAGLRMTPRQLFEHPTLAELAALAEAASDAPAEQEQGLVTGTVPLTPIQHWFLEQEVPRPDHWNMAVLLRARRPVAAPVLREAWRRILARHDALRLRLTRENAGWRQVNAGLEGEAPLGVVDLSALEPDHQAAQTEKAAARLQESLDLSQGPLARAILLRRTPSGQDRLLLLAHHMVVDSVSWQILVEDLERLCAEPGRSDPDALGPKTTSYRQWARRLAELADGGDLEELSGYWAGEPKPVGKLPVDRPGGDNSEGSAAVVELTLGRSETRSLLRDLPRAYNTRVDEAVLCALARTLERFTGEPRCRIELEGHGRDELAPGIDLSRTVGWFTALYPVVLDLTGTDQLGSAVKSVKEQLRAVPAGGLGYGLSRYLDGPARRARRAVEAPEILFNYLGQVDGSSPESALFALADESTGPEQGPETPRTHLLEINCAVEGGRFTAAFTYSFNLHSEETIRRLTEDFQAELRGLIRHGLEPDAFGYTPSDFPLAKLDQGELDELLDGERLAEDLYPLSPLQQGMLFHTLSEPGEGMYFGQLSCELVGEVDVTAFERAWQLLIDLHPALRTSFLWEGLDVPLQLVRRRVEGAWERLDWRALERGEQESRLRDLLAAEREKDFSLAAGPLTRMKLIERGEASCQLVWSYHQAVVDGWSLPLLVDQLFGFYRAYRDGRRPTVEPCPPYREYIAWLERQDRAAAEAYWRRTLAGFETPTPLPADREDGAGPAGESDHGVEALRLPAATTEALERFARSRKLTVNTLVQGAWALTLSRYSGRRDVVFGVTVSGRPPTLAGAESVVGLFINSLPARVRLAESEGLVPWLSAIQEEQAELRQYESSSLVEVQGWSEVPRGRALFDSLVVFQNYPVEVSASELGGLAISGLYNKTRPNHALSLVAQPGRELTFDLVYDARLFDRATAARVLRQLAEVIGSFPDHENGTLFEVLGLPAAARHQLQVEWNDSAARELAAPTVHAWVADQARRFPDSVAVVAEGRRSTYGELDRQSDRLAGRLRGLGVGAEARVGLLADRSPDLILGLVGVLKAGGAYVPLDPKLPEERLKWLIDDAGIEVLVSSRRWLGHLPESGAAVLSLDAGRHGEPDLAPVPPVDGSHLAYVIYTSGTTGRPKGVAVEHRQLLDYTQAVVEALGLSERASFAAISSPAADLVNTSIFHALATGGCLHLISEEMSTDAEAMEGYMSRHRVDGLKIAPSHLAALRTGSRPECVIPRRCLVLGGEAADPDQVREIRAGSPRCRIFNHYGPTETTVGVASGLADRRDGRGASVPIGRPHANARIHLLDRWGFPVPVGAAGELTVAGAPLARGYLNRPGRTAGSFLPDPFSPAPGGRLYRTGDLARHRSDGRIQCLGRIDHQVKIRGYRVEPGEVESAIRKHSGVSAAAVIAAGEKGSRSLVAYLAPRREYADSIDGHARHRLPNNMSIACRNPREAEILYQDIFELGSYLRHGVRLPEAPCVFDVGANVGLFTLFVQRIRPRAEVYAFEPLAPIFDQLKVNRELYAGDARLFQVALSDHDGVEDFAYFPRFSAISGLAAYVDRERELEAVKNLVRNRIRSDEEHEGLADRVDELFEDDVETTRLECRLRRLSDVIREEGVERIHLLKIDVQHAELDVLEGIDDGDWQKIDQVVVEVHDAPGERTQGRLGALTRLLESHGFSVVSEQDEMLAGSDRHNLYAVKRETVATWPREGHAAATAPVEEADPSALEAGKLREFLRAGLPEYMIPTRIVRLRELPLNAQGKVDRLRLPAPAELGGGTDRAYSAPRNPVEETVAAVWAEVLGTSRVDIHDDFFDLGGHSLLAIRLISRLRRELGVDLSLKTLLEKPTVAEVAVAIVQVRASRFDETEIEKILAELEPEPGEESREALAVQ